jgi:putative component of toxin-antitoxin plasmid stabilization module
LSWNVRGARDYSVVNKVHWTFQAHEDFDLPSFLKSLTRTQRLTLSVFLTAVSEFEALTEAPRSWIKPLGEGLFEFRIREPELLLRLFFTYQRGRIILLLAGYDKGEDPSNKRQQREIALARKRLKVG